VYSKVQLRAATSHELALSRLLSGLTDSLIVPRRPLADWPALVSLTLAEQVKLTDSLKLTDSDEFSVHARVVVVARLPTPRTNGLSLALARNGAWPP
jgi:hypothetical protein